jgi:hypothetical protein
MPIASTNLAGSAGGRCVSSVGRSVLGIRTPSQTGLARAAWLRSARAHSRWGKGFRPARVHPPELINRIAPQPLRRAISRSLSWDRSGSARYAHTAARYLDLSGPWLCSALGSIHSVFGLGHPRKWDFARPICSRRIYSRRRALGGPMRASPSVHLARLVDRIAAGLGKRARRRSTAELCQPLPRAI